MDDTTRVRRPAPTRRVTLGAGAAGLLGATLAGRPAPAAASAPPPAALAARPGPRGRARGRRPNVVVVLADDLGYGALGAYGQQHIRTPRLDRMAREGIRFTQGYAGASVCAPSRTTLLTGMHGGHARVRANTQRETGVQPRLLRQDTTVGQVLRRAGYRTGVFGKWGFGEDAMFVPTPRGVSCDLTGPTRGEPTGDFDVTDRGDPTHPLQKGFEAFHGIVVTEHAFQYWPDHLWRGNRRVRLRGNEGERRGTYAPAAYLHSALEFIERHRHEEFFLLFTPQLVHFPNQVPPDAPELAAYADRPWTPDQRAYAAQHTLLDTYVGRIVDKLEELGLAEDTLVLFTGDNGPTPMEHLLVGSGRCTDVESPAPDAAVADDLWDTNGGLRAGKHSLYEGGVRVPLIAWGPGIVRDDAARVADRPWGSVDLLPTLADLAGVTPPSDVDGVSVRDWITGERRGGRQRSRQHPPLFWERPAINDQNLDGGPPSALVTTTAARAGRWKAVRHAPGRDPHVADALARFELYDLESDRAETADVSLLHPEVSRRMQRFLRTSHAPAPYRRVAYRPRRTGDEWRR